MVSESEKSVEQNIKTLYAFRMIILAVYSWDSIYSDQTVIFLTGFEKRAKFNVAVHAVCLPFTEQSKVSRLVKKAFEKILEKGENACNQQFPQYFLPKHV